MESNKWFDREFDLNFGGERYAAIYDQLKSAPGRLRQAVVGGGQMAGSTPNADGLPEEVLVRKPDGKWSIKEQVGHLFTMEPLWRVRFLDIKDRKPVLTTADLNNTATTEAGFNSWSIGTLLEKFATQRAETIRLLDGIDALDPDATSLHPRLKQPMRVIDLAYFVSEHDNHHIEIVKKMVR